MNRSAMVAVQVREYIKNYLAQTGKKQEFLAKEMGYTPKRLSQLINGRAVMSIDDLLNICGYFREPVGRFLETHDEPKAG